MQFSQLGIIAVTSGTIYCSAKFVICYTVNEKKRHGLAQSSLDTVVRTQKMIPGQICPEVSRMKSYFMRVYCMGVWKGVHNVCTHPASEAYCIL